MVSGDKQFKLRKNIKKKKKSNNIWNKPSNISDIFRTNTVIFNRPGAAGAVLQTPLSFNDSIIH